MMERIHRNDQSGFTIIELMVAMTVGMMLMAILGGIYFNSVQTAGGLVDRINMNRQAREMFDILAMGGARENANIYSSPDYTKRDNHQYIFGLRGRYKDAAAGADLDWRVPENLISDESPTDATVVLSYKLGLSRDNLKPFENSSHIPFNEPILSSDIGGTSGVSISCGGDSDPISGCTAGNSVTSRGYLRAGISLTSTPVETNAGTLRIPLMLINPNAYYLSKSIGRVGITDDQIYDTYWTAFRPLVEYHP